MKEIVKVNLLKSLVYGYALMEVDSVTESNKDEEYIKIAKQLVKYFSKAKPTPMISTDLKLLQSLQTQVKDLDANYFKDIAFSPFIVAMCVLNYLICEMRDVTMRNRFGHIDTNLALKEVEMFFKDDLAKVHYVYFNKILDLIGE